MSDIALIPAAEVIHSRVTIKPQHLIFTSMGKGRDRFLTLDQPEFLPGFIKVKGIFTKKNETEIEENFSSMLKDSPKKDIVEILIPADKILYMRNLIFAAK